MCYELAAKVTVKSVLLGDISLIISSLQRENNKSVKVVEWIDTKINN